MDCPICDDVRMREVQKEGILIDVCPSCKGVWLDRGELDKLMKGMHEVRQEYNDWYDDDDDDYKRRPDHSHNGNGSHHGRGKHKRKKNMLDVFGDLFD